MARRTRRPTPTQERFLEPCHARCPHCGGPAHVAYHSRRTVATLDGLCALTLVVRHCQDAACPLFHRAYRPEEEGSWALPHGEFGLDVIALVGALRFGEHRSVPEIHRALLVRGVQIAERSVTELAQRYEELIALRLADAAHLRTQLVAQRRVILALDGLQPDRGHEVLWVIRDCLSGAVLLARSLLSATQGDLAALLREVRAALPVAVAGVISDGQSSIQTAVQAIFPGVPHQLCQSHYLREAAKPIFEADRHAKKELKKQVRGVRPLERALEGRDDAEAQAIRGYCLAVRGALTDDGRPPLGTGGLRLHDRLQAIYASIARVEVERGGSPSPSRTSSTSSRAAWRRPPTSGRRSGLPTAGCGRRSSSSPTTRGATARRCARVTRASSRRWPRSRGRRATCAGQRPTS